MGANLGSILLNEAYFIALMEHLFITGNKYTYKVKLFDAYKLGFRRLLKNMLTASLRKVFMLTTPGKQSSNDCKAYNIMKDILKYFAGINFGDSAVFRYLARTYFRKSRKVIDISY